MKRVGINWRYSVDCGWRIGGEENGFLVASRISDCVSILGENMLDFAGTPGTLTGFVLRILQCVLAVGSVASMATASGFYNFTAFWYIFFLPYLRCDWDRIFFISFCLTFQWRIRLLRLESLDGIWDCWNAVAQTNTMCDPSLIVVVVASDCCLASYKTM